MRIIRSYWIGIKSLWNWLPIIWKDRQWDHHFILEIFRHKLHLTEQYIRNEGHHLNNIKDADRIKICVLLLDRIMKDDYDVVAYERHCRKWGESIFSFENAEDCPGYKKLNIFHENVKNDEDEEQERKEFRKIIKQADLQKKRDLDYLFKIMNKYIFGWWD